MKTLKLNINDYFLLELEEIRKAIQHEYKTMGTRLTKHDYYYNLLCFGQSVWIDRVYFATGKPLPLPFREKEPRTLFSKLLNLLKNLLCVC